MKRVFVFCIGGTGIRVMKSIAMLLAAGMKTNGYQVVAIVIDPHLDFAEKKQLDSIMELYEHTYNEVTDKGRMKDLDGFFATSLIPIDRLHGRLNDTHMSFSEQRPFNEYLGLQNLPQGDINNHLVDTLFTRKSLDNRLSVGFKGNPNVGTVVLSNIMKGLSDMTGITDGSVFRDGDRIFIISSIFGGTGASGYPLVEKTIREMESSPVVKDAMMGAVSVQPYFSLKSSETTGSDIDSNSFITKTKAALRYYQDNVRSNYFYYIGDKEMATVYENDEQIQDDKAHFVELVAATALFDFLQRPDKESAEKPTYLSRAIASNEAVMQLSSLGSGYAGMTKHLADMTLLNMLMEILPDEKHFPLQMDRKLTDDFYGSSSYRRLKLFMEYFATWYGELADNKRSFSPFNIVAHDQQLSNWIKGDTLSAKDDSYYLLQIIKESNRASKDENHDKRLRHFLNFTYRAINHFTHHIEKS